MSVLLGNLPTDLATRPVSSLCARPVVSASPAPINLDPPEWVLRCRGLRHRVQMIGVFSHPDGGRSTAWMCRDCGKDRK